MTTTTPQEQEPHPESVAAKSGDSPVKTGMWMLVAILVYYALQAWILPAAGVQT